MSVKDMDLSVGCSKKSNEPRKKEKQQQQARKTSEREREREKKRGEKTARRAHTTKATRSNHDLCVRCPHHLLLPLAAAITNSSFINRSNIHIRTEQEKEKK
jgi:hypothetical protein